MKQIELIATASNFSAANIGKLSELNDYVLQLGPDVKIPGKVFGGAAIGATGGDFSFQVFQPGTETGFLHTHKKHEELYFFLSGQGEFQVDGQVISVGEGSVVRVAPDGRRSVRNNGTAHGRLPIYNKETVSKYLTTKYIMNRILTRPHKSY